MTDDDLDQIIIAIAATGAGFRGSHAEIRKSLRAAVGTGHMAFTGSVPERERPRGKPHAYTTEGKPVWKR
ncbi:hypothetical protein V1292_005123 [Bradyrhizobium sp. AZCC 1719]|uniref:hypothetical protein n=1 Tax=Bradyrhizobium sp. AZCC 1719 TaxID=3117028 RepID=UPI002FF39146